MSVVTGTVRHDAGTAHTTATEGATMTADTTLDAPPGDTPTDDTAPSDGEPDTTDDGTAEAAADEPVVEDPPEPPPDPTTVDVVDDGPPPPTDPNRAPWSALTPEQIAALDTLRAPVRDTEVGYKPTVWCRLCTDEAKDRSSNRKTCSQHAHLNPCPKCGQRITEAHFDLTFMGHAAVTRRLLDADPTWEWEPMAVTTAGTPVSSDGGMWIRLTVAGMTRPGFGDAASKSGGNAVKEVIGDAIRNAAMRFGCGLELWHKGDWNADDTPATDHADAHNGPQRDPAPSDAGSSAAASDGQPSTRTAPAGAGSGEPFDLDVVMNTLSGVNGRRAWTALRDAADHSGLLPAQVDWRGETMPLHEAFNRRAAEIQAAAAPTS